MSRRVLAAVALALVATGASAQYVPRTFHDHAGTTKSDATDIEIDETTGLGLHKQSGAKIRLYLVPSPTPTPTLSATPTVTLSATPTVTQTPVPSPTPDTADQMSRSTAAGVTSYTALPDCDTSGLKCVYDQTTHAWSAVSESDPKVGTLTALKLCFSNAGGTAIDCTTTINAGTDVTADLEEEGQIGGVTVGGTPGDDKLLIGDSSSGATWRAIADCTAAGGVLQYGTAANASGLVCHTLVDTDIPDTLTLDAETFSVAATVTAGTNARGQGALTKDINVITTATAAPSGVTLPAATTGRRVAVVNRGANTVNVYPNGASDVIDGLGGGAAIALPVNRALTFHASSTTQWYTDRGGTVPILDYATTATAAGTTTLTAASAATQYFTGGSTQTVKLPSTATLALGSIYAIVNLSTGGAVTVQSSGANTIVVVPPGTSAVLRAISTTLDTAAGWDAPATLFVSTGTGLGAATRKIEFSSDFTTSTSNGITTVVPGATFKMDGEAIAPAEVPGNIQPSPGCNKLLGPANEQCFGHVTQKYCNGGTSHGATCSANSDCAGWCQGGSNAGATCTAASACPSGACSGANCTMVELHDGEPVRSDEGFIAPGSVKPGDLNGDLRMRTSAWNIGGTSTDILSTVMGPVLWNDANDRLIRRICWKTNANGAALALRRDGPPVNGTPIPTPAFPTPTAAATPGYSNVDAGCVTGLALAWPKYTQIWGAFTQATGVTRSSVVVTWEPVP